MIMMGLELTGDVPFREVHMHGLVRDAEGKKMAKTRGNVIDPLDIMERFGTDAVRLSLLLAATPGTDFAYTEDRLTSARGFANKIWNAARLIFMNLERSGVEPCLPEPAQPKSLEDRWIFSLLSRTAESVNASLSTHRFHEAGETLWHFFWHDFCDWYLEVKKLRLAENSGLTDDWRNLLHVFGAFLRLLHPIMPFLTEELWHRLGQTTSIALAPYPQASTLDEAAEREMALLQEVITAARTLRADRKLGQKESLPGVLYCRDGVQTVARHYNDVVERLANVKLDIRAETAPKLEGAVRSTPEFDLWLETPQADEVAQRSRLEKEIQQLEKLVIDKDRQLGNEKFLSGAPPKVIDSLRDKRAEYQAQLEKSLAALASLK